VSACVCQVRLYDIRVKRRPVLNVRADGTQPFTQPFTSVCFTADDQYVIAGDCTGSIRKFDVRKRKPLFASAPQSTPLPDSCVCVFAMHRVLSQHRRRHHIQAQGQTRRFGVRRVPRRRGLCARHRLSPNVCLRLCLSLFLCLAFARSSDEAL
jgi:hypothetical protein